MGGGGRGYKEVTKTTTVIKVNKKESENRRKEGNSR